MEEAAANPALAPKLTAEALDAKLRGYGVHREVGRGAMGIVFEARQGGLGRRVAIKVLPPNLALRDRTVKRFLREAEAMGRLSHANVVDIYEVGSEHDTLHYFAMQYVEGPPLDLVLRAGALAIADVVRIGIQVSDALAHAHSRGVMHRDIKPSNLLRSGDDVLLTDFGLARPLDSEETGTMTESGDLVGTPLYMSPEQISGDTGVIDGRSDVWGLGITLYELLIQKPPFTGSSATQILNKILHKDPPLLRKQRDDIPRELEAVILKCLEKDPARRYSGAAALHEDLCAVRDGQSVSASSPRFFDPAVRWMQRNPTQTGIGAFALVAVTALTILSFREGRRANTAENMVATESERADNAEDDKQEAVVRRGLTEARVVKLEIRNELTMITLEWERAVSQGQPVDGLERRELLALDRLENLRREYPIDVYPDFAAEVLEVMASYLHERGRDDEAIAMLEREDFGEGMVALQVRAAFYTGLGQLDKALELHHERMELAPDSVDAHLDAGRISRQIGEQAVRDGNDEGGQRMLEQARTYLSLSLSHTSPGNDAKQAEILTERAQCWLALGRTAEANTDLDQAIEYDSTLALARALRARPAASESTTSARAPLYPVPGAEVLEQVFPGILEVRRSDLEAAGDGIRSLVDGMRNLIGSTRGDPRKSQPAETSGTPPVAPK